MKQRIFFMFLSLCLIYPKNVQAQGSHWACDTHAYEYDMGLYFSLSILGDNITDYTDYEIAAFCGKECRGVADIIVTKAADGTDIKVGYVRVRSNNASGDDIVLRIYDKQKNSEFTAKEVFSFVFQNLIGMISTPEMVHPIGLQPIVISAKSYTRVYGEGNPKFDYEVQGDELSGIPEIECSAVPNSSAGVYPITINRGTISNDSVLFLAGKLTITPAPLTITAKSYTRKQGEENPTFEVSYEGWKNGEMETVLTKLPKVSCEADEDSKAGDYVITVSGAEAENYDISYVPGKLTVTVPDAIGDATQTSCYIVRIYTVGGKPLKELQRGVNIVMMSDGTTRKVVVK